ncbi:hypothetical protein KVR01_008967 [Diaporthe batatas]|uniref:uncharacterized protein n=1 Tax=Diaporthe batatas TaxID=748121 RepID=UPI001D03C8AA|nr:uncharacterized protein KVR01_008967 [Diaporthe batatas]KAG8160703.1 hypothetical protein KVR01_008967 [Diaporthe batatas]
MSDDDDFFDYSSSSSAHADSLVSPRQLPSDDGAEVDYYPVGFPLNSDIYDTTPDAQEAAFPNLPPDSAEPGEDDWQTLRQFRLHFPYEFLDRDGRWNTPAEVAQQPLAGQLRQETIQKLALTGHHVEFVPAWTDPGWEARFVHTGREPRQAEDPPEEQNPNDDPLYRMYARPGLFQTLRPALLEQDAVRNPTDAAKRYGIDPNNVYRAGYGKSAATPMQVDFNIPLTNPRVTPSNQGVKPVVDQADYDAVYRQYQNALSARGGYASEDDFRAALQSIAPGTLHPDLGASCDGQVANALLQYMDQKTDFDLREDYQRMLFGGISTNELVEEGAWTMDKTAVCELNSPLHDLLTRDKWAVTTDRGISHDGEDPKKVKKVYNFPTQKGEYCATNRHLWAAVNRKEYFATYLDEDPDEFMPEQEVLKSLEFNSVYWVCEILKKCLTWDIMAKYDDNGNKGPVLMGVTQLEDPRDSPRERPFTIRISISADYIWPLLIDEYTQAEKAHAVVYAREQLFNPLATWLRFDPTDEWRRMVGPPCLRNLMEFGYRQVWDDARYATRSLVITSEDDQHTFLSDERQSEEGWAIENQYWGAAPVQLGTNGFLPETRFIDEVLTMCTLVSWPGDSRLRIFKRMPFPLIGRLFTRHFWNYELEKWGHEAMKMWPISPPRATCHWTFFNWRQVQFTFGWAARAWLQDVDWRVRYDWDNVVVWTWLKQLTRLAVEPRICSLRWYTQKLEWKQTDKSLWSLRNDCSNKATIVRNYIQQLHNEVYSEQPLPNPTPPIEHVHFRNAFAAMAGMHRALSNEASFYQAACADYHRQPNPATRADIYNLYAADMRRRLDTIHLRIIADCIAFLDTFTTIDPLILLRIAQSEPAVELLDQARPRLRERFVAVQDAFRPVRQTFDENHQAYAFHIRDFANVHPNNAQDNAKRIERMARKHMRKMSGPVLKVVEGWMFIIKTGALLRVAQEGTPLAEINNRLAAASAFVGEVQRLQRQQVDQQYPPPPSGERAYALLSDPRLANIVSQNQNDPDPSLRRQRFNTVSPERGQINSWQAVYAEASGFVPYQDPTTGFTRFYQANIPTEAGPFVNPAAAAAAQAQGQSLVGAFTPGGNAQAPGGQPQAQGDAEASFRGLLRGLQTGQPVQGGNPLGAMSALLGERGRQHDANPALSGHVVPEIYNRALQTVAGPNGQALVNTNMPGANNIFGASAAQSSLAQQQMEALIRQQTLGPNPQATLGNFPGLRPGVGVAPPTQTYEPVGGSAFPANPAWTAPNQQGPSQPQGGPPNAPQPPRFPRQ